MRNFAYRKLVLFLCIAFLYVSGFSQSLSPRGSNGMMPDVSVDPDKLKVEIQVRADDRSIKAFVVFFNASQATLWFPVQGTPTYRPDEQSHLLHIWFGYFDEVDGVDKGHYMLPDMHAIKPGEKLEFELTSPKIRQELLKMRMKAKIRFRVATKAFAQSRIRNNQPIEDYINNSIVVQSDTSASK
jgi:hypothetical protein